MVASSASFTCRNGPNITLRGRGVRVGAPGGPLRTLQTYRATAMGGARGPSVIRSGPVCRVLRVADASVMSAPVSASTNATVYAIAERAAELLRAGARPSPRGPAAPYGSSPCNGKTARRVARIAWSSRSAGS